MALKNVFGDVALETTQISVAESINNLNIILGALSHSLGVLSTDSTGRLRTIFDTTSAINSVNILTRMDSVGLAAPANAGIMCSYDQYGQMMQGVHSIRNCIQVS
jgi:hypothetical protein